MRTALAALLLVVTVSGPLVAQGIPVFDFKDLAELVKIVKQVKDTYDWTREEYATIQRMGKGFPSLSKYRLPGLPIAGHTTGRFLYGQPMLDLLNAGDPSYAGYWNTTPRLRVPNAIFETLPLDAQLFLRSAYAGIEIIDSVSTMSAHQVGIVRGYQGQLQEHINALEADVTGAPSEMTAVLDKIAVAKLLALRAGNVENQLTSALVEQNIAEAKENRDADVNRMNMILYTLQDNGETTQSAVVNATGTLQGWRFVP